jgi:predicted nucleic acid-binding protein
VRSSSRLVVDASVALKWYVPEPDSDRARRILGGGDELIAPDLLVAEFGNILWKKVRRGELADAEAEEIAEQFTSRCPVLIRPSGPYLRPALEIGLRLQRTVYDSLYLALAVADGAQMVTADARLVHALDGGPLAPFVRLLE